MCSCIIAVVFFSNESRSIKAEEFDCVVKEKFLFKVWVERVHLLDRLAGEGAREAVHLAQRERVIRAQKHSVLIYKKNIKTVLSLFYNCLITSPMTSTKSWSAFLSWTRESVQNLPRKLLGAEPQSVAHKSGLECIVRLFHIATAH